MPLTAAALVTAGVGAYKAIKGIGDSADAKKRAKYNIRPTYDIQPEYFTNQGLAANMAQSGLTDEAKNYYQTNSERGLGSSLGALLQTGGGINSVQKLYDSYDRGAMAIAAEDSQQKINNIKYLMGVNNQLADQKTQKWVIDKYQPYLDEAKSIAGQKAQGSQMLQSGISDIAGAATGWAKGQINKEPTVTSGATPGSLMELSPARSAGLPIDTTPRVAPFAAQTVSMPSYKDLPIMDSYDGVIDSFTTSSRNSALAGLMNKYKDSPYAAGLFPYLQTA